MRYKLSLGTPAMYSEPDADQITDVVEQYRYPAFISYSRADLSVGEELQRELERYRVPPSFRGRPTFFGPLGSRIRPIFRDQSDLEANRDLEKRIRQALRDSAFLIVLCSPVSAASRWVNQEIVEFKRQGGAERIITVLVAGFPAQFDPILTPAGAFPPALLDEVDSDGKSTGEPQPEPTAADLRGINDAADGVSIFRFKQEILKIVSALTTIPLTELSERAKQADRIDKRNRVIFGVLAIATVVLVGISGIRYWTSLREESVYLASLAREEYSRGNSTTAAALALEAIPKTPFDRPMTSDAEKAVELVLWRFPLHRFQHAKPVVSAAFDPSDHRVVTASDDRTAAIWDVGTGKMILALKGHNAEVTYAEFSSDGNRVITASYDGTARIWDASSGAEIARLAGHERDPEGWEGGRVYVAHFSPDGKLAITIGVDETARIWDAMNGRQLHVLRGYRDAVFSPNSQAVSLAPADDQEVLLVASDSGRKLRAFACEGDDPPRRVRFSRDGMLIAGAGLYKLACVWNVDDPSRRTVLRGHEGTWGVNDASFSPDGERLVTSGGDGTVRIWDVKTGKQTMLLQHPPYVTTVRFSPDGTRILSASQDKTARIWDAQTGIEIARLDIHNDIVQGAEFSHNGRYVVTASNDKTAGLWDSVPRERVAIELCDRVPLQDRILSAERRSTFNLAVMPRDPCRASFYGLAPLLRRVWP